MLSPEEIAARLAGVRQRISRAALRSQRPPEAVNLLVASKGQPAEAIRAAYEAGARCFGENYVQEALAKRANLADLTNIRWHMIGHLQTNKAKLAANSFELIQSLDCEALARALSRHRKDTPCAVLVEVNLGGEATKSGVPPGQVEHLIDAVRNLVDVRGLMTIPPPAANGEQSRGFFAELRELRDRLSSASGLSLTELSMGMTDDFEVAIEEGATIVRIGRAILGERPS